MAYVRKQITISPLVADMLQIVADMEGESVSGIINDAIKEYVSNHCPEVEQEARNRRNDETGH